jgi:protein-disulfide isomerase
MAGNSSQNRRIVAGVGLVLVTAAIAATGRLMTPPFEPPVPDYRAKGTKGAPVVITEFSDFQCPACQQVVGPLNQVLKLYPGKIEVRFRHMPWGFHQFAGPAAVASECAGKQGKFWEYHDALFDKQRAWSLAKSQEELLEDFKRYANAVGLDSEAFAACVLDPAMVEAVAAELKENQDAWIKSTPTMVINGRRFIGARQLRTVGLNYIENELKKAGQL